MQNDLQTELTREQQEIERLFIGAMAVNPDYARSVAGWLQQEIFCDTQLGELWASVQNGEDYTILANTMGIYTDVIGWLNNTPSYLKVGEYATAIKTHAYMRYAVQQSEKIVGAVVDREPTKAYNKIVALAKAALPGKVDMMDTQQVLARFEDAVTSGDRSIPTTIKPIDLITFGLERGTTSALAGRPSMGKTAMMLAMARGQAKIGKKVGIFSLEQGAVSLWARMACPIVGLTWMQVRSGKLPEGKREELLSAATTLAEDLGEYLFLNDKETVTTNDIWATQLQAQYDVIYVDHLRLLKNHYGKYVNENKRMGRMSMELHDLSKVGNCVIVACCQLNRALENRAEKRPTMADLRDSGELEENFDNVFTLYRPSFYDDNVTQLTMDETEFGIAKFRDGARAKVAHLVYDLETQTFMQDKEQLVNLDKFAEEQMEQVYEQEKIPF
jgi:replicative DNA helicase